MLISLSSTKCVRVATIHEIAAQGHPRSFILQSVTARPTKGSISWYNIAGLISEVSAEVATEIAKNCRRQQFHSHLRSPPKGTPASIHIHLIFSETRVIGLHFCRRIYGSTFIQTCALSSKRRIFSAPESTRVRFGRSRSSKVNDFGIPIESAYATSY